MLTESPLGAVLRSDGKVLRILNRPTHTHTHTHTHNLFPPKLEGFNVNALASTYDVDVSIYK
jgi:hypothetical protein